MTLFETETMAELCAKQGQIGEALAIYRRLVEEAPDAATRTRRAARLVELEERTTATTLSMPAWKAEAASEGPSLRLERRGDHLTFAWTLPRDTEGPALQLFLLRRGTDGIETETRTVRLDAPAGTTTVVAPGLVSLRAAVGRQDGARFVPMARLAGGPP